MRILLEKLILHLVQRYPVFYGTQWSMAVLTWIVSILDWFNTDLSLSVYVIIYFFVYYLFQT